MVEHTKGPWFSGDEDEDMAGVEYVDVHAGKYCHESYRSIAHVQAGYDHGFRPLDDEARANARLIAAAPALLEALKKLAGNAGALGAFEGEIREVAGNTNWQCLKDAIAQADAAIALARGDSA